jgi:hypothetical protein
MTNVEEVIPLSQRAGSDFVKIVQATSQILSTIIGRVCKKKGASRPLKNPFRQSTVVRSASLERKKIPHIA